MYSQKNNFFYLGICTSNDKDNTIKRKSLKNYCKNL
jgi:hypothetical protein